MRRKNEHSIQRARAVMRDNPGMFCDNCIRELLQSIRYHLIERDFCQIADELGLVPSLANAHTAGNGANCPSERFRFVDFGSKTKLIPQIGRQGAVGLPALSWWRGWPAQCSDAAPDLVRPSWIQLGFAYKNSYGSASGLRRRMEMRYKRATGSAGAGLLNHLMQRLAIRLVGSPARSWGRR
jgi:hypothetical protein